MDFNLEVEVIAERSITDAEAYKTIYDYTNDESGTTGIYKIQIDELLRFIKENSNESF